MKGICTPPATRIFANMCDFHRDGGSREDKCPGICDGSECYSPIAVGISYRDEDKAFCTACAPEGLRKMLSAQ